MKLLPEVSVIQGGGISLRFKSSTLDLPKDLASGGCVSPPSVDLSFASAERASPRSKSWKIKAHPPCLGQAWRGRQASLFEKRHHPVITYLADLFKSLCVIVSLAVPLAWSKDGSAQVQPIPADVGLVTQLSGDVTYWNEAYHKTPEKAVAFMKIRRGDHFALPEGARLQVVYFASNRQESWAGPARLVIGQAESENLSRDAQPEVIVLPPGASQGVQRIPALLRRAGLSRTGGLQVRGMTPPQAPGGLSPDEEAEIQNARRNYQDLRKQAKPDDLTPELYLLGILADYEQFEEMEKVLKDAQTRQPGNEVLKELEAWVRTQRSQPGKKK